MKKTYLGVLPVLFASVVISCAPATQILEAPEPRPLGRDLPTSPGPGADRDPKRQAFAEPTGDVTLREALVAALTNNAELAAFGWEVRAKEAEALQAGLRPNPEVSAEVENFGGSGDLSGFGGFETTIALAQLIELGGKRGKRLAVGQYEQSLAAWDYEAARMDILTETTKAFIQVLAAQEQVEVAEELVQMAEEVLSSAARRVEAGSASPVEESRAKVELETSRMDRDQLLRSLTAARTELSAFWGGSTPVFSEAVGNLQEISAPPPLEALQARIEQSPELARWASELDHRRAALDLERSLGSLDVSLGAGVRYLHESNDAALLVGLSMPLPISDRNQGASRAAALRVNQAEDERRAMAIRYHTRLAVSYEALLAAESEVRAIRDRALPEAETAFQLAQDAYLRGSMRFTDVLDTERLLFELRNQYIDALALYHTSVADIERLIGESVETARQETGRP